MPLIKQESLRRRYIKNYLIQTQQDQRQNEAIDQSSTSPKKQGVDLKAGLHPDQRIQYF